MFMHGNFGVIVPPHQGRAFERDSAVAKGGPFGTTGDYADVLGHGSQSLGPAMIQRSIFTRLATGYRRVKQIQELELSFRRQKGCFKRVSRQLPEMFVGESE